MAHWRKGDMRPAQRLAALHNPTMKIAAVQMVSGPSWPDNRDTAARLTAAAAADGAGLIALPENFCLMGMSESDKVALAEAQGDGPIQRFLSELAREHSLWLIGGTLPVATAQQDRVLNRLAVFAPDGSEAAHYDKIHLFAFESGRESYDEGRTLHPGVEPVAVQAGPLRVGLSICYDLRFPELYRALMVPPCELLVVPSAFTYTTGSAHWELLLRARAVENQCYVLAPAQGGSHANGRRTWGHSMIVDPWGEVLAVRDVGEGFVVAEVDADRIARVRTQLPALAHRRL
jgi:deaminated glutathione amidase